MIILLTIEWGWVVAGAAPGLQIRVSGRRTFRGVFDSHASPPNNLWCMSIVSVKAARSCLFLIFKGLYDSGCAAQKDFRGYKSNIKG